MLTFCISFDKNLILYRLAAGRKSIPKDDSFEYFEQVDERFIIKNSSLIRMLAIINTNQSTQWPGAMFHLVTEYDHSQRPMKQITRSNTTNHLIQCVFNSVGLLLFILSTLWRYNIKVVSVRFELWVHGTGKFFHKTCWPTFWMFLEIW